MKNKIIIFLVLASFNGFSQITRTLSNVNNTADSMKPVSTAQKAAIVQKLHTVATISALQAFTDATIATFDGSQWNKVAGNVASNGGAYAGTIINVNTSFYWSRKYNNLVSPDFFGISPANSDNKTQIQNYINFCALNGYKRLKLPSGVLNISAAITIGNNDANYWGLTIEGDSPNITGLGTTIQNNGTGYAIIVDLRTVAGGLRGITIKNLSIRGNAGYTANGIKIINNQLSTFENIYFYQLGRAFVSTGDTHYAVIDRCKWYDCSYGVFVPLDNTDADFVINNSNNCIIQNSAFSLCNIKPLYLGDGQEWVILNCDFEGSNGLVDLSSGNKIINTRVERNNYNQKWVNVRGDFNNIEISVHDIGGTNPDWRVFVAGNNNIVKINSRFASFLLTESGYNNDYQINLYKTPQIANSHLICVRESSKLSVNSVNQGGNIAGTSYLGQNLSKAYTTVGSLSGATTYNPQGTVSNFYNVTATNIQNLTTTNGISVTVDTNSVIYCSTNIQIKSVSGQLSQTMTFNNLEKEVYIFDEWINVFSKNVTNSTTPLSFSSSKIQSESGTGAVAFGLTKIAINQLPVNFFENSTTQSELHKSNCFSNSLQLEGISLSNISTQIINRSFDNNFRIVTTDKQNLLLTSTANIFSKLDKMGIKLYRVDNSTGGVLGNANLKATLKGWSVADFGFTKYIEIDVSRPTTADSWTYTTGGYRYEKGCAFNFANSLGSLAGTTLDGMTFEVNY